MEYPTLFTGETTWFRDPTYITEQAIEHEFGHQYWYGMVATNEFEDAWLDEGINSYTEVKVLAPSSAATPPSSIAPTPTVATASCQRSEYLLLPDYDPVTRWAFKFRNFDSYGGITYGKSATLLATLEDIIGRDTMDEAMRTYFLRYRFTHPTTEDFLRTIEQVAISHGKAIATAPPTPPPSARTSILPSDEPSPVSFPSSPPFTTTGNPDYASAPITNSSLRDFFNQAVYGTQILDYAIDNISYDSQQWWLPNPGDKTQQYLSTVYLHRKGDFILPLTVEIVFDDGTRLRERWNGVDRWTKFTYTRNAKIISAEIDPDHTVLLDSNFFNNSYTTHANPIPARKLTNIWMSFNQLVAQLVAGSFRRSRNQSFQSRSTVILFVCFCHALAVHRRPIQERLCTCFNVATSSPTACL